MTDLAVVWDTLGDCGSELIENYLLVDMRLSQFSSSEVLGCLVIKKELQEIKSIIAFLIDELTSQSKRCNEVLAETPEIQRLSPRLPSRAPTAPPD
jgi:hypothetical protein